jgi:small subunit ribosomal protein S9
MENAVNYLTKGRRKEAIARVVLSPGKGDITCNKRDFDTYFTRETDKILVKQPLRLTNTFNQIRHLRDPHGRRDHRTGGALRHAISRALLVVEPELKDMLRKNGFLTRDPRMKERKKSGQKGARKRFQWTKR